MTKTARMTSLADMGTEPGERLQLQCPTCRNFLAELPQADSADEVPVICSTCLFHLRNQDGVWIALPEARGQYFSRFVEEYQAIRAAEGRGSKGAAYYLALPYRDLSGHNQWQWAIRARTYRTLERSVLPRLAAAHPAGLDVLDLGAGNGWMSYRLALRRHRPVAIDLLTNDQDGLAAAAHFSRMLPDLFPRFQAELDRLPFLNCQFDVAIFNASFHYSENYEGTLGEAIRCLRPGGTVIIADTAWYCHDESGRAMVAERRDSFIARYGFASNSIGSLEYLTDDRLRDLERRFGIHWKVLSPFYGVRWALRPLMAKLSGRREPSSFRIYMAEVKG